ncbi:MAG: VOC family protein [Alphaproteobacteria bacterium]|nr:VOC family protein [Alphaproteobacteria bacterium]
MKKIAPCLWFDDQAEEAAGFYCSLFPNSKIVRINRYPEAGGDVHGKEAGSVMTVEFELNGQPFLALNGGPHFRFNEAVSMQIPCESQAEVDFYWSRLVAGGGEEGPCGWVKDRFGLSWQITPTKLAELFHSAEGARAARVMTAMLTMRKLDLAALEAAGSE